MRVYLTVGLVALGFFLGHPTATLSAAPKCSEGEQAVLHRLVDDHKAKVEEAQAVVERQRTINTEEALRTGHVSYPNEARLITFQRQLSEWRQIIDHDVARYQVCFGYPPYGLAGLGTSPRGFAGTKAAPTEEKTKWSGTWYQGPYTIQVSGGHGSMSYSFLRASDVGTCCPTIDQGTGTCTTKGNIADCRVDATFHNSASEIHRTEHAILTYEGETISVKSHVLTATLKTDQYHPCPEIAKCTSLHPGADLEGTWTRQKP